MLLQDLEYFLRIAETGSLRQAAELASVSQPAVTKGLRRLEVELGLNLVERSARGARLTENGRAFLERAKRLHGDLNAALREANDLRAGTMELVRIGLTPALVEHLFVSACAELTRQLPEVRFKVRVGLSDDLLSALRQGEIDLMVSGVPNPVPPQMELHPIGDETLSIVARQDHPLMQKQRPTLLDLKKHAWVLPPRGVFSRDWLDAVFMAHELPLPFARVEFTPTHDGLLPLVLQSDLLSLAGEAVCRRLYPAGLRTIPVQALRWHRQTAALTRSDAPPTPLARRLIDIMATLHDERRPMGTMATEVSLR